MMDGHGRRRAGTTALGLITALLVLAGTACSGAKTTEANGPTQTTQPAPNGVGGMTFGPPDGAVTDGGKLTYGIDAEPEGLDPTKFAFSQAGHAVASAVFDPLATVDDKGNYKPYLATAIDHSSDNKTWTFTLPDGVAFHDGSKLDAAAVVTVMSAHQASPITGPALNGVLTSVEAKDPTHVVFNLKKAAFAFPLLLTTQAGYIVAPAMLTNPEGAKKPVGSGAFVFDSHEDGKVWRLKKNPTYWNKGLPHLDTIEFQPVADNLERATKLSNGDLDVIQILGGAPMIELRNSTTYKRVENLNGDKTFLMLNTTKPPFDKLSARQALAHATDASAYRKEVSADTAKEITSPYGVGQPGYLQDNGYPKYDVAEAKRLTKQYETEAGAPLEFEFLAVDDTQNAKMSQLFQEQFAAVGMKVTVKQLPQINLLAQVAVGNYQLSQFRLFAAPNPDADVHFYRGSSVVTPGISINFPRYVNPEVDAAIDAAVASGDNTVRAQNYEKVSKIFAEQVPFVWLGQTTWMLAANPKVNGIYEAANGTIATIGAKTWIANLSISR